MSFDVKRGVHVASGSGVVAHLDGLTAFASGDEAQLNTLVVRLHALAGEPWTEVIRALTTEITTLGYDAHPNIACVSVESDRVMAFVFGESTLSLLIDGEETLLDGRDSSTWIDVTLHSAVTRVMAGTQSESAIVGVLREGVVPASGFMLDVEGPMPASSRWHEHMPVRAVEPQAEELPASAPVAAAEPALVEEAAEAQVTHAVEESTNIPTPEPAPVVAEAQPVVPIAEVESAAELEPAETAAPLPAPEVEAVSVSHVVPTTGVAIGAADIAAAGLFARLDERMPAAEEIASSDDAPVDIPVDETEDIASSASVFDNPDLIDGQQEEASVVPVDHIAQPEVAPAAPLEPAPIASLTQTRPQIRGIRCEAGHLTKPDGSPCITCGARIDPHATEELGDRPVLGRLTFDDGAELQIERPAAIGSDVPMGYTVDDEPATVVRLDDGAGGIDGVHLEVRLSGWNVNIADMNSTGGTYTMLGGERTTRTKLRSGQTMALQPGMTVEAGRRTFTYSVGPTPPTS